MSYVVFLSDLQFVVLFSLSSVVFGDPGVVLKL